MTTPSLQKLVMNVKSMDIPREEGSAGALMKLQVKQR